MARNAAIAATIACATLTAPAGHAPLAAQMLQIAPAVQGAAPAPAAAALTLDCGDVVTSLNCADLVPTPDLRRARARLTLTSPSSPFGVSVTADGRPLVRAAVDIDGLPEPSTLGNGGFRVYVAWLTTLTMSQETRLGEVKNGHTELGTIDLLQYRVIVSAEASADVKERRGRLVLRATSPSARLLAHRDMLSPAASALPGGSAAPAATALPAPSARQATPAPEAGGSHHHAAAPAHANGPGWTMPPMNGMPMMPGMSGLTPSVRPYLPDPSARDLASIQVARSQSVYRVGDGANFTLEATLVRRTIRGRTFVMYGFNDQYPGPLIQVPQGATILVDFRNRLDMPSSIHWHGVRLDNQFDGTPGVTQEPVPPGGRFTYRVHFKDAGLYWYHPHVREDIQQDLGLYGNMLVDPASREYYGPANRQEIWMLDDLSMTDDGALVPYGAEQPTHALMGRFGNVFLVNGEPDRRLRVRRGEVVRFFFTNVSNTRLYNLSFGGAPMKVVGSDVGKFEHEAWVTSVVLAPAERYIVDVQFTESGMTALTNRVQSLNHMRGSFFAESHTLATINVRDEAVTAGGPDDHTRSFRTLRRNVDVSADIDRFRPHFTRAVERTLTLTLRTRDLPAPVAGMLLGPTVPIDWNDGMPMENWLVSGREATWILREPETGRENMDVTWTFAQGDVVKLRFVNDAASPHPMSHPIHIHGQRFLVLARNGVANDHLVWKDTTIIAAGETVDVLLELSNPGRWMLHCHIAEHLGTGMMTVFEVRADSKAAR
jgi:suppressor of ftsI